MKRFQSIFIISFLCLAFIRIFIENAIDKISLINIDWIRFSGLVIISTTILTFAIVYLIIPRNKRHNSIYGGVTVKKRKGYIEWLLNVFEMILFWTAFAVVLGWFKPTLGENVRYLLFMSTFMGTINFFVHPLNNSRRYSNKPQKDSSF